MTHGEVPASGGFVGGMEAAEDEIAEGTVLDSSIGYLAAILKNVSQMAPSVRTPI